MGEGGCAEAGGDGNVGGIATDGHEDAPVAWIVVTRIHIPPTAVEPHLVPGAEVAGCSRRHANVADVSGDIARGDVHAARERDGEMLKVPADADALGEDVHGCLGG